MYKDVFLDLVIERFGRWGTKAEYFCSICHNSQQTQKPILMFSSSCRIGEKDFLQILQRCNAKVILRKLSKLSPNHGDLDRLFDFDIQSQVH